MTKKLFRLSHKNNTSHKTAHCHSGNMLQIAHKKERKNEREREGGGGDLCNITSNQLRKIMFQELAVG